MEDLQKWDFNAPMFVNFCTPDGDENAEEYFEFDHESGIPVNLKNEKTNEMDCALSKDSSLTKKTKTTVTRSTVSVNLGEESKAKSPNTSRSSVAKMESQSSDVDIRTPMNGDSLMENLPRRTRSATRNTDTQVPLSAQRVGIKRSASLRSICPQPGSPPKSLHSTQTSSSEQTETTKLSELDKSKRREKAKPTTPSVVKRNAVQVQQQPAVKKTEDLELEKIAHFRAELAKKRKLAMDSCKVALSGKAVIPVTMEKKPLTKPEEFKFETDARIKTHKMETRNDTEVKDFASILRANKAAVASSVKLGPTKPEPFKLTGQQRKRKFTDLAEKQAEDYETMAEKVAAFTRTPDRFRSKPRESRGRSHSPPHGITIPKTPQLETQARHRPVTAPSREILEQKELEEMQKNQFKAHPMNQKIFQITSLKKGPSKPPTVIEEFALSCNNNKAPHKDQAKEENFEFHAQPLNKRILEGTVGVKEAKKLPVTVPESPAFALKLRTRMPLVEEMKDEKPRYHSRSMPHYGVPFQPKHDHKITEPEPFGFEEREKQKAQQKTKKIEQFYEEEQLQHEFHANPIPILEPYLPPKRCRPLTAQNPFNLDTDLRGAKKAEEWSKKIKEELEQQKEMAKFKARNASVLEHEPFVPHKENKHSTEISEFELNTAKRVVKREVFEMHKKMKQDEIDNIHHQEQLLKEAEEKAKLANLRREAVHKANPVKHYKSVLVKRSDKPLTEPLSPTFQTDTRLRTRAQHAESFMPNDK